MADTAHSLPSFVMSGVVPEAAYSRAQETAARTNKRVELVLNQMGALSDDALAEYFKAQTGFEIATDSMLPNDRTDHDALNLDFLRRHQALILSADESEAEIGVVDPTNETALSGLAFALQCPVKPVILKTGDWRSTWSRLFEEAGSLSEHSEASEADTLLAQDRDAPVVRKVSAWLSDAADLGASDIHFEARRDGLDIRYRVDGALRHITTEAKEAAPSIVARLKVLSGLDLGERRKPQDGRATIVLRGRKLDIRTSIVPSIEGESAVLRLLDRPQGLLTLEALGFAPEMIKTLEEVTQRKEGLFLVSGPTGSGKTTTLYACLEMLRGKGLKILSVEDPVEYQFDHVTQVQVSEKAGVGFAETLRSFLRHDPEVILVGEIRDAETARTAVQAAFTGHLVLASIHAIDAHRVRDRLQDMGVESFKLDACLIGSMAQRLSRKLCPHCKTERAPTQAEERFFIDNGMRTPLHISEPGRCSHCRQEGYLGRLAISEFVSRDGREHVTLIQDALDKAAAGETALSDVLTLEGL